MFKLFFLFPSTHFDGMTFFVLLSLCFSVVFQVQAGTAAQERKDHEHNKGNGASEEEYDNLAEVFFIIIIIYVWL